MYLLLLIQEELRLPSIFWTCHSSHYGAGLDCSVHILYLTSLTLSIDPCLESRQGMSSGAECAILVVYVAR